jgi:putative methyltransferase (TIGR04325 family)
LVANIGNDNSGTHCGTNANLDVELSKTPIVLDDVVVAETVVARKAFEAFLRAQRSPLQKVMTRVKALPLRQGLKAAAKNWLPPALARQLRRIRALQGGITFSGPYASWEEASKHSGGYDEKQILEKVLSATIKVKNGEAVFERDSVLFNEIQYSWPVTAGLMWAAAQHGGRLSVLDFGGALGSSYFQNRKFLEGLKGVRWSVVEQAHFVDAGKRHIQDDTLVFYSSIADCVAKEKPNVVVLSGVLQYLESPYGLLDTLLHTSADFVILDRTPFLVDGKHELLKVQITPASIYPARYPIRYFCEEQFFERFHRFGFAPIERFLSLDELDVVARWKGAVFRRVGESGKL